MPSSTFKAAAVLAYPEILQPQKTIDKILSLIAEAAGQGAELMVFPETFLPEYPWWIWTSMGSAKRTEMYRRLYRNSVEVPGPEIERIARAAAEHGVNLVVGVSERAGGTLYNAQVIIDSTGRILGKRRKLMPTGQERTIWGRGYGSDIQVHNTALGRLGSLICYEHSMPLARAALYALGEQIHAANWPGANFSHQPRDRSKVIDAAMRHMAFEGQVFVVFSSSCVGPEEVAMIHEADPSTQGVLATGGGIAGIVDPYGRYIAGPVESEEALLIAEIDLDLIPDAKMILDSVGHYARNDLFTLLVDNRPRPGARFGRDEKLAGNWAKLKAALEDAGNEELLALAREVDTLM